MEAAMASQGNDQATIEEIRKIYRAMINRLRTCAANMPDELVGKLNLAHLETFLEHSEKIDDPDKLEEFFLVSLSRMKCSVDGARFSLRGLLIDLALEGLENDDATDGKWITYAAQYG
jgi:hypothetical protein